MKNGDIIRWFETYAEGITKCAGLGYIMETKEFILDYDGTPKKHLTFEVWRFYPHNDMYTFGEDYLEKLK